MRIAGRWIAGLWLVAGCAPAVRAPEVTPENLPSLEAERARRPNDQQLIVRLGAGYYRANRYRQAIDVLRAALALRPTFPAAVFLGLSYEGAGLLDSAAAAYRVASGLDLDRSEKRELEGRIANLTREQLKVFARQAVAQENTLSRSPPTPNAVAVLPWRYLGANQDLAPLEKGITHLVITDLSRVASLRLVERERVQALTAEMALAAAQRTEPGTGARSGRLLRAARVVQGSVRDDPRAGTLRLDATVVTTQSGAVAARGNGTDRLAQLFAVEKQLVLDLLRQLGIALSAAERQAILERPTSDLQAFLAFSRGLEAEDRGDFATAAAQFQTAVARDPNFREARVRADAIERVASAGRTATELAGLAARRLEPTALAPGRAAALRNAISVVAPTTGDRLLRRTLSRSPLARSRLTEALRQDDPTGIGGRGEIIIIVPRP
jgi:TolB-like protein/Tfp pilus assembly protein PilF